MSSMKKSESKNVHDANVSAESAAQDESHEMLLHREWVVWTREIQRTA